MSSSSPGTNGLRHRLRYVALSLALLLLGLWLAGSSLWQLGKTAVFVHEAVVVPGIVVDVRQKPFETWSDTLGHGNLSMPGDVSYQPMVRFVLPGGISAFRGDLEADNRDYACGEQLEIISLPNDPSSARLDRWKFLWGASCLRLGAGALLTLIGYGLLRRLKGKRHPAPAPAAKRATKASTKPARRRKSGDASSTGSRRRRKAEDAPAADAVPKPRRSRKKKAEPQQGELPI